MRQTEKPVVKMCDASKLRFDENSAKDPAANCQKVTLTMTVTRRAFVLTCILLNGAYAAPSMDVVQELIDWIEEEDGYLNPKQEISLENPNDINSRFGIFATERIEEGELLAQIPWDIILPDDVLPTELPPNEDQRLNCETVQALVEEIKLKDESEYSPYVDYLLAQPKHRLPSSWSQKGKELFLKVLGGQHKDVLMDHSVDLLEYEWQGFCKGNHEDELGAQAALLVKEYSDDGLLIPINDLYSHRNGLWYNAKTAIVEGETYNWVATRTIEPGEQLHDSINQCEDCEGFDLEYGFPGKKCICTLGIAGIYLFADQLSLFQKSSETTEYWRKCLNVGRYPRETTY